MVNSNIRLFITVDERKKNNNKGNKTKLKHIDRGKVIYIYICTIVQIDYISIIIKSEEFDNNLLC